MQEVRLMVILKGIVLLVCTGMVVGMYSNYVTSVVAKTKRRVMVKPGFHIVVSFVSAVSVVRKKFIGQIEFILSRTTSYICRFFCIEHLYGRFP